MTMLDEVTARAVPHTAWEDALAVAVGCFLVSLGVFFLDHAGVVTGGTPGLALLVGLAVPLPFAVTYAVVSAPFLVIAAVRLGPVFAARTVVSIGLVAAFSLVHPHALTLSHLSPTYGTLVGNLAASTGLLVLFRHGASLGGFGAVALIAQERRGWNAGMVQLAFDGALVLLSALVAPLGTVLLSLAGVVLLNVLLAMNHRPGRYLA